MYERDGLRIWGSDIEEEMIQQAPASSCDGRGVASIRHCSSGVGSAEERQATTREVDIDGVMADPSGTPRSGDWRKI
jgi:hypothetical protein